MINVHQSSKNAENKAELLQSHNKLGQGVSFGTFGELLQGTLCDDETDFLVTLPIGCYSRATFISDASSSELTVLPPYKTKSARIASRILQHFELPRGGTLEINSGLEEGKGLSSSSADLVATARAISDCFSIDIADTLLQDFMREIEPSDGVMHPGIVSFYHRRVQLREFIGDVPPFTIVAIDEGGMVDTIEFNKIPKPFVMEEKLEYQALLDSITKAVREKDLPAIGRVATRSALMNQKLMPKKNLQHLIKICEEIGGLGVIITHSGTCLGILLSSEAADYQRQLMEAQREMQKLTDKISVYYSWNPQSTNTAAKQDC